MENGKIFLGISFAIAAAAGIMFATGVISVPKRKLDPNEESMNQGAVTNKSESAATDVFVLNIRKALQASGLDIFNTVTDAQFKKLHDEELLNLQKAIVEEKKYRSEPAFKLADPMSFNTIVNSYTRITGKTVLL